MEDSNQNFAISGETVSIRPIRLTDASMEAEFVRQLSPTSKHYRFLGGVKELSPKEVRRLCDVDGQHSMAFVATILVDGEEKQIGVSRYAPNSEENVREMAVTVADDWQNAGLGTKLAKQLINHAKDAGITRIYSLDLAENTAMHELAMDLGMDSKRDPEDATQVIYSLSL